MEILHFLFLILSFRKKYTIRINIIECRALNIANSTQTLPKEINPKLKNKVGAKGNENITCPIPNDFM